MNHFGIQRSGNFSSFANGEPVVCPKPRRLNLFNTAINEPSRALRWQMCYQQESYESNAGPELLDLILSPEQTCTQIPSSPPFFCGSPPSRVSNPLIQDARFEDINHKISPISPCPMIPNPNSGISSSSPVSSTRTGGYLRPSVRIEGFNCLDRGNRRSCSIAALA